MYSLCTWYYVTCCVAPGQIKKKLFKLIKHTLRLGVKGFVGVAVDSDINFPYDHLVLIKPHTLVDNLIDDFIPFDCVGGKND